MYKDTLLEWLNENRELVFTSGEASKVLGLSGPALSNLLGAVVRSGDAGRIIRGKYYFKKAPVKDIFAISSKIIQPSYVATESAFERYGLSDVIPRVVRVITVKAHRQIKTRDANIRFIKFKQERFFGYNESRWISISTLEKAFIDSLYLGEFPFFTDLVKYHKRLIDYGRQVNYEKVVDYALRMRSKTLLNRVGFFLEYIGEGEPEKLFEHIYRKGRVEIDKSGQSFFNSKKWMIE